MNFKLDFRIQWSSNLVWHVSSIQKSHPIWRHQKSWGWIYPQCAVWATNNKMWLINVFIWSKWYIVFSVDIFRLFLVEIFQNCCAVAYSTKIGISDINRSQIYSLLLIKSKKMRPLGGWRLFFGKYGQKVLVYMYPFKLWMRLYQILLFFVNKISGQNHVNFCRLTIFQVILKWNGL